MIQNGETEAAVTPEFGQDQCDKYKFFGYVECSAKLFENCGGVFFEAIKAADMMKNEIATKQPDGKSSGCNCTTF